MFVPCRLDTLLGTSSLQVKLVRALSCLTFPSIIMKDLVSKIEAARNTGDWNKLRKVGGNVSLNRCPSVLVHTTSLSSIGL